MNKIALKLVVMLLVSSTCAESHGMAKTAQKSKVVRAVTMLGKTLWKHKYKTGAAVGIVGLITWDVRARNKKAAIAAAQFRFERNKTALNRRVRDAQGKFEALAKRAESMHAMTKLLANDSGDDENDLSCSKLRQEAKLSITNFLEVFAQQYEGLSLTSRGTDLSGGQLPIREILAILYSSTSEQTCWIDINTGIKFMNLFEPYLHALEGIMNNLETFKGSIELALQTADRDRASHKFVVSKLREFEASCAELKKQIHKYYIQDREDLKAPVLFNHARQLIFMEMCPEFDSSLSSISLSLSIKKQLNKSGVDAQSLATIKAFQERSASIQKSHADHWNRYQPIEQDLWSMCELMREAQRFLVTSQIG